MCTNTRRSAGCADSVRMIVWGLWKRIAALGGQECTRRCRSFPLQFGKPNPLDSRSARSLGGSGRGGRIHQADHTGDGKGRGQGAIELGIEFSTGKHLPLLPV
jgi:hypothetical protein